MFQRLLRTLGIFVAVMAIGMGNVLGYTFRMTDGVAAIGDGSTAVLNFGIEFVQGDPAIVGMRATITYPEQLEYVQGFLTPEGQAANNDGLNPTPFSHTPGTRTIAINLFDFAPILNADTILATLEFRVAPGLTESGTVQVSFTPNIASNYVTPSGGTNQLPTLFNGDFEIRKLFNAAVAGLELNEDSDWTAVTIPAFTNELGQTVAGTVTSVTAPANGQSRLVGGVVEYRPDPDYFGDDAFTYTATATVGGYVDTATVNVTVNPVNDPPEILEIVIVTPAGGPLGRVEPPTFNPATDVMVDPATLLETGDYRARVKATDKDTDVDELTASVVRGTGPGPVRDGGNEALAYLGKVLDNGDVYFYFDFPVDYDTVQHPARMVGFLVEVTVNDNDDTFPGPQTATDDMVVTVNDVDREPTGTLTVEIPPTATTDIDIVAVPGGDYTDPDGDAITVVYQWATLARDGFVDEGDTLSSAQTTRGQVWQVTALLSTDPYGDGAIFHEEPVATAQVEIVNSDPVIRKLAHKMFVQKTDPSVPPVSRTFNLAASEPFDADGDPISYIVTLLPDRGTLSYEDPTSTRSEAFIDSVPTELPFGVSMVRYTVTDPDIEFFNGNTEGPQADVFEFKVTDNCGDNGNNVAFRGESAQTATVTVEYRENQPPEVVVFSPEVAAEMDEVIDEQGTPNSQTFSITFTDENDPSGNGEMDRIEWYVSEDDGTTWILQGNAVRSEGELDGDFTYITTYDTIYNGIDGIANQRPASKVFQVKAVGIDTQGGETEHIWGVTVNDVDRLPSAPVVEITPEAPYTDDDLLTTVTTASVDPDGDPIVGYQFDWSKGDRVIIPPQDTLPASETSKHETWQVSVRAVTNPYGDSVPKRDMEQEVIVGPEGTAEVTILNSSPVATDDSVETDEKTAIAIPVIVGNIPDRNGLGVNPDTDADGDELRVKSVTQPEKGTTAIAGNGMDILFDPNGEFDYLAPGDEEIVTFDYAVTDDDAIDEGTDMATVTVVVTGVNDQAIAQNLTVTTDIDSLSDPFTVVVVDPDQGQEHDFVLHDSAAPGVAPAPPVLKAPDNGTVVFAGARGEGSVGEADLIYIPDAGFTGVDTFEFAAWDGYDYSTIGTVTVVVGTPLWYPYFDLNDLLAAQDQRPGLSASSWYHIEIVDEMGKTVVDTSIYGTEMNPIDYFRAGSEGLLPGTYTVYFETWNPGTGAYGGQGWVGQIVVNDYGYADFPTDLEVVPPISRLGMGPGAYVFEFRAMNGRGYILKLYRNGQAYRTYRNVYLPSEDGKLIPLNQLTSLTVNIDRAGDYTAEVRAFNPLDESVEGNLSRADTPGPRWSEFAPFTVVADGDAGGPADPAGQVFPNGQVFMAPSGSIEITLQWNPIPEAVGYRLYLGAGNAAPIFDGKQVGATTSWRVNVPLGTYMWQVVGVNASGNGIWSAPYVFDVVRDATAPLIRRVLMDDVDRGGNTLRLEYAPDSIAAAKVDIQHYQMAAPEGWQVYSNVAVDGSVGRGRADFILVPGAQFQVGDFILVRAYSAGGKRTDYRVFIIE